MELAMMPAVEGRGMSFWAMGSGRKDVLGWETSQHLVAGVFVEQKPRDSGEVTRTVAGWGGHRWACVEYQLLCPAL